MEIAVVVEGGVTETLQATPLLRTLRTGAAAARIVLLCPASAAALSGGLPGVDETLPLSALDQRPAVAGTVPVWAHLRRRRLDAVLLCSGAASLRLAAYLAGVPRRLGPAGGASSFLLTDRSAAPLGENPAVTWLRLASLLGLRSQLHGTWFDPGGEARGTAARMLVERCGGDGRRWIALAPGSGNGGRAADGGGAGGARGWEPERYALLANAIAQRTGAQVLLVGSPADRPRVEETMVDVGVHVVDFTSERDLRVTAAIISRCDVLVAADDPLLHLAAAVGTSAVGLFGPTQGRVVAPYGGEHRVLQALGEPCSGSDGGEADVPLMHRIRVDDVLAALKAVV